jgi:two-component system nitrate/nitrite response regulator NarL
LNNPIRIVVIDDHPLFRQGVVRCLSEIADFTIVGEGSTAGDAITITADRHPDVVLMDLSMPGGGLTALGPVLQGSPSSKIVVLTVSEDGQDVAKAIGSGAAGYVLKGIGADSLADVIRSVATGKPYVSPSLSAQLFADLGRPDAARTSRNPLTLLSGKELEVLKLVGAGQSNKRVALALNLHEKSIKRYLTQIFRKLNVTNRTEAAILLRDHLRPDQKPSVN